MPEQSILPENYIQRTTPIGLLRYADEYFKAALCVDESFGTEPGYEIIAPIPELYLTGHAIELVLKAYLLFNGVDLGDLKFKYGHDLIKLLDKAKELNIEKYINIERHELETLYFLNELYLRKQLEYIETGAKEYPVFGHIQSLCEKLIDETSKLLGYQPKYYIGI